MSLTDTQEPDAGGSRVLPDTFCTYLAKQFIAKRGFRPGHFPEAERLATACDLLLTASDGYSLTMLCMVDRELRPGAQFSLSVEEVRSIGDACLRYAGKVNGARMPVSIMILEIGPPTPGQQQRLQPLRRASLSAKVIPSGMVVDTVAGEVWSSHRAWIKKGSHLAFIEQVLTAPRETDADLVPPSVVIAPRAFPILTAAILASLVAVFVAEIVYGIGPPTGMLRPTIATLVGLGGLTSSLVRAGEWYRLLSAPFLHADLGHLFFNCLALFIAGIRFEYLVGRAWFGTTYVVGAICGSLGSLALNPASLVSVGASGAITGLFAAMLIASRHFPVGVVRTSLQMNALYVLIPSLLPLAGALHGTKVDYGAHFGGAIGGAAVGLVMLATWSRTAALPGGRTFAAAIACAGALALTYPALGVPRHYATFALLSELIPADKYPRTSADVHARAEELVRQFPRDPRAHLMRAGQLLDLNDRAGAEREARAGLADESVWQTTLPGAGPALRAVLAASLDDARRTEALEIARPACEAVLDGPVRRLLTTRHLCDR